LISLKKATILIAEDEESNFISLEAVLENYNANLIHAYNRKETIKEFKIIRP
jgi:response regulator RpfG family c-di-GMP phosphodiesterase